MNFFLGVFYSTFIILVSADNTFDPVLQSYRSNYLTLKGSSFSTLDKSFFDVYNLLKSKISEVRDTYSIYSVIMNKTCTSFQYNTTRSSTGSRLMSFCGTLNTIMEYTDQELDDLITTFYYGTLGGDTEPLKIADYMWQSGDDNLNSLPFLFNRSPNCMSSYLGNYLQIFRRNINTIVSKSTIVTRNITSRFSDMTTQTRNIGDFIKNMSNELNDCNKLNDSTKCVREFLVKFSNCDEKSTCASEKLQETIKNCTSLVNEIRIAYHENMMDAKDQIGLIDDDLDTLADLVMKCATKTTARAVTTTARSVRNAITTTAARGITTARTRPSRATTTRPTTTKSSTPSTTTSTRKTTTSTSRATSTKSTSRPTTPRRS